MNAAKLQEIKNQLSSVPTEPGVYLWKNAEGEVIYVGKAKQLRARMRQYVNFQDSREKIPLLVSQIDSFEYVVTSNEHESLVLERNLIKQYSPYFNADFKDDKSYPFIALTKGDVFPAIKYTRETHKSQTRYFGPYTDSRAARELVDTVRRVVPICAASCAEWRRMARRLELRMKNWNYRHVHALMLMSVWAQVFVVVKWTPCSIKSKCKELRSFYRVNILNLLMS